MWKVPDLVGDLLIDALINESKQKAVLPNDPYGSVTSADHLPGEIGNALQQSIEVELRGEGQAGLHQGGGLALRVTVHEQNLKRIGAPLAPTRSPTIHSS